MSNAQQRRGHGRPGRERHRFGTLIDNEPNGPGDRARRSPVEYCIFYSTGLGRCRVRPAPDPSKKSTGLRPQMSSLSPRGRVLVHPGAGALPGTRRCRAILWSGRPDLNSFPWQAGRLPYIS
jgi:hypothetical protein